MAAPISNTKIRAPLGFGSLLEGVTKEVLRYQPDDIYDFCFKYFTDLLKLRDGRSCAHALNFLKPKSEIEEREEALYQSYRDREPDRIKEDMAEPVQPEDPSTIDLPSEFKDSNAISGISMETQNGSENETQSFGDLNTDEKGEKIVENVIMNSIKQVTEDDSLAGEELKSEVAKENEENIAFKLSRGETADEEKPEIVEPDTEAANEEQPETVMPDVEEMEPTKEQEKAEIELPDAEDVMGEKQQIEEPEEGHDAS
ncbi:neurogranin (protein kinase C substrate, RC3) [Cichlidogyrus casuarinus]|uniref:Neurogranin (Protein kinase C substrate, RC3) n=1 Tax=Cichlidogyrus casuarinus TaxID=1844966 RepID=A0ABD2PUH4_9PLAT